MASKEDLDSKKGIVKQVDEWFGRRHRFFFFIAGIGIAYALFSFIFVPVVLDQVRKDYESIIGAYTNDINVLHTDVANLTGERDNLQDSLAKLSDFGIMLNTVTIPVLQGGGPADVYPIFGYEIQCFAAKENNGYSLDISVDTCDILPSFEASDCRTLQKGSFIDVGRYCQLYMKDKEYFLYCSEGTDSTITLILYQLRE